MASINFDEHKKVIDKAITDLENTKKAVSDQLGENSKPFEQIKPALSAAMDSAKQINHELEKIKPIYENMESVKQIILEPVKNDLAKMAKESLDLSNKQLSESISATRWWAVYGAIGSLILGILLAPAANFMRQLTCWYFTPETIVTAQTAPPQALKAKTWEECVGMRHHGIVLATQTVIPFAVGFSSTKGSITRMVVSPESSFLVVENEPGLVPMIARRYKDAIDEYDKLVFEPPINPNLLQEITKEGSGNGTSGFNFVNIYNKDTIRIKLFLEKHYEPRDFSRWGSLLGSFNVVYSKEFTIKTNERYYASSTMDVDYINF